jgi:hypothetical protein
VCTFLNIRKEVSCPHKGTVNSIFAYILILIFLNILWNCDNFCRKTVLVRTLLQPKNNKSITFGSLHIMITTQNVQPPSGRPLLGNTAWSPFVLSAATLTNTLIVLWALIPPYWLRAFNDIFWCLKHDDAFSASAGVLFQSERDSYFQWSCSSIFRM